MIINLYFIFNCSGDFGEDLGIDFFGFKELGMENMQVIIKFYKIDII